METKNINDFYDRSTLKRDKRILLLILSILILASSIIFPIYGFVFVAIICASHYMFICIDPDVEKGSKSYKAALTSYKEWARSQKHSLLSSMRDEPEKFDINTSEVEIIKEELQNRYYRYIDEKIISESE